MKGSRANRPAALSAASVLLSAIPMFAEGAQPSFTKDVAPIIHKHCIECHRPGEAAPMSFTTYSEVRPWAKSVKAAVLQGKMPPWYADPKYGHFSNDRSLTKAEIETLVSWVDAGSPQGNPADLPPLPKLVQGWGIGTPDQVFDIGQDVHIVAKGVGQYVNFTIDPGWKEDKWVQMAEVRPTTLSVVHHVIVFMVPPGAKAPPDGVRVNETLGQTGRTVSRGEGAAAPVDSASVAAAPGAASPGAAAAGTLVSEWLASYAPGEQPIIFEPGTARLVPAGSKLQFNMHYTPNGQEGVVDRTSVGFVFAKEPVKYRAVVASTANGRISIPPNDPNYELTSSWEAKEDVEIISFYPHMHLRGKDYQYTAQYPEGSKEVLLSVPNYDFNWQLFYKPATPIRFPKGSKLLGLAHYDNSANNKYNPDPNAKVTWCEDSACEMMIGWFYYRVPTQQASAQVARQ
jgi:hypothetical protein